MNCFFRRCAAPLVCVLFAAALSAVPAGALSAAALPQGDGDGGRRAADHALSGTILAGDAADSRSGSGSIMVLTVIGGICGVAFGRWFGRNVLPWAAAGILLGAGSWAIVEVVIVMLAHPPLSTSG